MYREKSTAELEKMLARKMNEVYELRMEISRRKGDVPQPTDNVNFEKYLTD